MDFAQITQNRTLFIALQVLAGLIIVLILYIVTLLVLNTDSLVVDVNSKVKQQEKIPIFKGKAGIIKLSGRKYNTVNPFSDNFKKIAKSINQYGGAQFTYQFWVKVNDTDDANFKDLVILTRGDIKKYRKGLYNPNTKARVNNSESNDPNYMIKCPLIKFGKSYRELIVEFNTSKEPSTRMEVKVDGAGNSRKGLLSLLPLNWYLLTFVLEDNFSYANGSENGIKCTLYVNGEPYHQISASTDPLLRNNHIKQNDGNLFLFPNLNTSKDFMQIGDMTYFNYALTYPEINSTFLKGPPTFEMKEGSDGEKDKPAFLSAYNRIDIYNY